MNLKRAVSEAEAEIFVEDDAGFMNVFPNAEAMSLMCVMDLCGGDDDVVEIARTIAEPVLAKVICLDTERRKRKGIS